MFTHLMLRLAWLLRRHTTKIFGTTLDNYCTWMNPLYFLPLCNKQMTLINYLVEQPLKKVSNEWNQNRITGTNILTECPTYAVAEDQSVDLSWSAQEMKITSHADQLKYGWQFHFHQVDCYTHFITREIQWSFFAKFSLKRGCKYSGFPRSSTDSITWFSEIHLWPFCANAI